MTQTNRASANTKAKKRRPQSLPSSSTSAVLATILFASAAIYSGCGEPSGFRELPARPHSNLGQPDVTSPYESSQTGDMEGVVIITEDGAEMIFEQIDTSSAGDGNAERVEYDEQGTWRETFLFGGNQSSPLVDYLILMDNSCSMERIIEPTAAGLMSLVGSDVLPKKSRVGVLSTMHGDEDDLRTTGIGINRYAGIDFEPGFLELVNRQAIINYKAVAPRAYADKWPLLGCSQDWFQLDDVSPEGDSCLVAATQATYHCVGAEAGIRAFRQLLEKNRNKPLFREGTVLNVIFISDTHDPGTNIDFLLQTIPTYGQLAALANETHNLAGMKFHALAPDAKCTSEGLHGKSYFGLAETSAGKWQDPCHLNDYQDFFHSMAKVSGIAERAVFTLSRKATSIDKVLVNGQAIRDYRVIGLTTVIIDQLKDNEKHTVEIHYSL